MVIVGFVLVLSPILGNNIRSVTGGDIRRASHVMTSAGIHIRPATQRLEISDEGDDESHGSQWLN